MFIDPASHGSSTSEFALQNLHKSPGRRGLAARCVRGEHSGCIRFRPAAIGAGFRAAGRGLRLAPTCGRSRVREPQAGGASSSADALRLQPARGAGRRRGRLPAHFLRFVARLFANEPFRAHFFRFVAEADAPETPRLWLSRAKPQVRRTTPKMLIESEALETPRTAPKGPRPARNRATNRKKTSTKPLSADARRPRPSAARRLRAPAGSASRRRARRPLDRRPPPAAPHPACEHPAAHFLRFVAGASARAGFVHIF